MTTMKNTHLTTAVEISDRILCILSTLFSPVLTYPDETGRSLRYNCIDVMVSDRFQSECITVIEILERNANDGEQRLSMEHAAYNYF